MEFAECSRDADAVRIRAEIGDKFGEARIWGLGVYRILIFEGLEFRGLGFRALGSRLGVSGIRVTVFGGPFYKDPTN